MNLRERAYYSIKEDIEQMKLKPGTQLIETELSEQLGVSRTPIREAIRQLVNEGLATTISPRMTVVSSIDVSDVEEIYEVRQELESLALELAFTKIDSADVERMIQIYSDNPIEGEQAYELDLEMHHLWINQCNNQRLIYILDQLEQELTRYRIYSHNVPAREALSIKEHLQILEAIQSGDLPRARLLLKIHLENTKNNIMMAINRNKVE